MKCLKFSRHCSNISHYFCVVNYSPHIVHKFTHFKKAKDILPIDVSSQFVNETLKMADCINEIKFGLLYFTQTYFKIIKIK